MSSMHPGAAAWRHIRSDRSVVDNRIDPGTVRRVFGFARPHRRLISVFLALTVVDAAMVVVMPLLVLRIVDDGILADNGGLVTKPSPSPWPAWSSSAPCWRSLPGGCPRASARG